MTPHIEANVGEYAEIVLMPGDPLRAKFIAETFLRNVVCVNTVRNCLGFTGYYKDKRVSVQASGMGQPSIGIYATELFKFYNVQKIIRIGTCGSLREDIVCGDVVIATNAISECNPLVSSQLSSQDLYFKTVEVFKSNRNAYYGKILSLDNFYQWYKEWYKVYQDIGIIAVDMETYMLYNVAAKYGKEALTLNLVSDNVITGESISSSKRVTEIKSMTECILESL